jgi:hypothetical protein
MASDRRYEVDELLTRPGTYFNPQTEVLVVVDDSSSMDNEIFNLEEFEGADWVLVADDLPLDEAQRDELLEDFQAGARAGDANSAGGLVDPEAAANAGDAEDVEPPRAVVPLDDETEE